MWKLWNYLMFPVITKKEKKKKNPFCVHRCFELHRQLCAGIADCTSVVVVVRCLNLNKNNGPRADHYNKNISCLKKNKTKQLFNK